MAASLCCIAPVSVLAADTRGLASAFSRFEPFHLFFRVHKLTVAGLCLAPENNTTTTSRLPLFNQPKTQIYAKQNLPLPGGSIRFQPADFFQCQRV
jgi:hypothetical protein